MPSDRSYRCSFCDVDWPVDPFYKTCPECSRKTWEADGIPPIGTDEAKERRREIMDRAARRRRVADWEAAEDEAEARRWIDELHRDLDEFVRNGGMTEPTG